jgi:hypothetical protein
MRYPGIEAVFERHGMGGCGGANGPVEPIGFFARVHQVDPPQLLRDLNDYATGRAPAAPLPLTDKRPERRVELYVLGVGAAIVLTLLAGLPMGILAALGGPRDIGLGTRWTPLVQAHGHLQLMGWVGLFLAGIAFFVLPRFKQTDLRYPYLARPAIGLLAAGLAVRTISQPYSDHDWVAGLMVASAAVEVAGIACFVAVVTSTLLASRRKNYDWYLLAACGWLAASAAANLVVVAEIALDGQSVIASAKDGPLLTMQLYGFIGLFIFGVSIRILPHFLSLRPPSVRWFVPALVLYNAGLIARVLSGWAAAYSGWTKPDELEALGVYAMAAGVLAFALALKLHLPARRDEEGEAERGHVKIIRTAYAWFAVAVAIEIWMATRSLGSWSPDFLQAGVARHALALGFATGMLMGVGSRTLPTFAGRTLHSRLLLDISFWMLNIAVFTRVGSALFAVGAVSSRFDHIAASGALTFLALALFAYNIGRSVLGRPEVVEHG